MAAEEIRAGEYGLIKFILLIVVAVIVGNLVYNAAGEGIHKYRRAQYLKKNPGAVTNQPAAQMVVSQPLQLSQQPQSKLAPNDPNNPNYDPSQVQSNPNLAPDGTPWQNWS